MTHIQHIEDTHRTLPAIQLSGLAFSYGKKRILESVDLPVHRGEILGLLGPNGSGKSTILSLIAGLNRPESGTIEIFGDSAGVRSQSIRRRIGVAFQACSLDRKLTTLQNLKLSAQILGLPSAVAQKRIASQLKFAGLEAARDQTISELSGGMQRKLDLARALLGEPDLLLLDEPTAALDELAFRQTWDLIRKWTKEHRTSVLLTTHRPAEAQQCDRLAVLAGGNIVRLATPAELLKEIADDIITVEAADLEAVQTKLMRTLELESHVDQQRLRIYCSDGHTLIPRIVELFPGGQLHSVSLRHPDLGDVFLNLTGFDLSQNGTNHVS